MTAALSVRDLTVRAHLDHETRTLIDAVSFDLGRGEILGLVGESGSGKSLLCRAIVRLLPSSRLRIEGGSILLAGHDLVEASTAEMLDVRGGKIGMIFQNPTSHLDPVMRIGDQISEGLRFHEGLGTRAARAAAIDILAQVGFPDPPRAVRRLPARILRRHAPAGDDRHRPFLRPGNPDRRRAHHRPRRHHPEPESSAS